MHVNQLEQCMAYSRFCICPGFFLFHLFLFLIQLILPPPDPTMVRVTFEIMLEIFFYLLFFFNTSLMEYNFVPPPPD